MNYDDLAKRVKTIAFPYRAFDPENIYDEITHHSSKTFPDWDVQSYEEFREMALHFQYILNHKDMTEVDEAIMEVILRQAGDPHMNTGTFRGLKWWEDNTDWADSNLDSPYLKASVIDW